METKRCSKCKSTKDTCVFSKDKSSKDGLSHRCKECQKALSDQHYAKNKNKYKETFKKNKSRGRAIIHKLKEQPCEDCGIQHPPWVMQFDHIVGEKRTTLSKMTSYSEASILEEAAKCHIVCANCHANRIVFWWNAWL